MECRARINESMNANVNETETICACPHGDSNRCQPRRCRSKCNQFSPAQPISASPTREAREARKRAPGRVRLALLARIGWLGGCPRFSVDRARSLSFSSLSFFCFVFVFVFVCQLLFANCSARLGSALGTLVLLYPSPSALFVPLPRRSLSLLLLSLAPPTSHSLPPCQTFTLPRTRKPLSAAAVAATSPPHPHMHKCPSRNLPPHYTAYMLNLSRRSSSSLSFVSFGESELSLAGSGAGGLARRVGGMGPGGGGGQGSARFRRMDAGDGVDRVVRL